MEKNCRFGTLRSGAQPLGDKSIARAVNYMDMEAVGGSMYNPGLIENFCDSYDSWIGSSTLNQICGLHRYERYMSFAITHAIEQFLMKHRNKRIRTFSGEYPGTVELIKGYEIQYSEISTSLDILSGDALILSVPFSGSGNQHPLTNETLMRCNDLSVPVMLDFAFFGTCKGIRIDPLPCIELLAFSLSKCFSLQNHRIGMIYTNDPPYGIKLLHDFGYTSRFGASIALKLFDQFGPDYAYHKYRTVQEKVCLELGDMTPSDTILFGNGNQRWKMFDRGVSNNRISFGSFLADISGDDYYV